MKYDIMLTSENINYIKVTRELVNDYLKMINDEEVQKYISHKKKVFTLEGELEWIDEKLKNNSLIFSMIEKDTNEFIGNIEIMEIINNIGEIGISITPSKQNKHYGQEAIKTIINFAINELKLDGLELNVYNFNERGIHCYEKVGFVIAGEGKTSEDIHMIYKK